MILKQLMHSTDSCTSDVTMFAEEFAIMDEYLEPDIARELKMRVPRAYEAAQKKYIKHAQTYQQLPWALARITEPTGPVFLRAFLAVFYPELAKEAGVTVEGIIDDESLFEYHSGLMGSDCGAVTEYLATAVPERETQLCYERLLNLSVASHAEREYERVKLKSKEARNGPRVNDADKRAATFAKEECLRERRCFTMGFRELCDESAQFLSEVVRVSQSRLTVQGSTVPVVDWGKKCSCSGLGGGHAPGCWKGVNSLYKFMEPKFFHVYVHQMLIEGCFNIIDHNQKGASAELKTAALNMKVLPHLMLFAQLNCSDACVFAGEQEWRG
jgi:hypothetical protein